MSLNSVTMTKVRPTVIFDAADPEHRRHAWLMIRHRTFKHCPYIWALTDGHLNVFDMIHRKLIEWYTDQEFAVADLPQAGVVKLRG
jgi:hypothetical protein